MLTLDRTLKAHGDLQRKCPVRSARLRQGPEDRKQPLLRDLTVEQQQQTRKPRVSITGKAADSPRFKKGSWRANRPKGPGLRSGF